ncbi:coiled-coil domain-containing protein 92-like [Ornithodoros turicata]|uniref:coiled-coil domain-containing protein 92-like n=1 Tax=Ornithodoros turicata TaxID=34597 RepID=UPI003139ECA6
MSVSIMATEAMESAVGMQSGGEPLGGCGYESCASLKSRLHSAKSNILFLQNEHRLTLRGLHAEIAKLQKTIKELQFALINNGIPLVDEESYKKRVASLEDELDKWCCHCRYLTSQLEQANGVLVSLNQRLQLQDWQHQTEIAEKDSIIANLQRELEWKCTALSELEAGTRRRSLVLRLPQGGPPGPSAQSTKSSNPVDHGGREANPIRAQKRLPLNKSSSTPLQRSMSSGESRLPEISQSEQSRPRQGERRLPQTCVVSRPATSGQTLPKNVSSAAKCAPNATAHQNSPRGTTVRLGGHLPPLADGGRTSPFPTRSLVRQQLRVHCDAGVDIDTHLSIDRIPSPELRPRKVTATVLEVSSK